ncbi:MAG: hypothetical protein LC808_27090, partial [Actinobacteria bacterium]|nr:hypothetical protein [Actinomycetota bacterium]
PVEKSWANPFPRGTFTPQDTPSFSRRDSDLAKSAKRKAAEISAELRRSRTQPAEMRIPVKLDSRSGASWSLVPEQSDQPSERSDARWSL